jgi:hypothetical protein
VLDGADARAAHGCLSAVSGRRAARVQLRGSELCPSSLSERALHRPVALTSGCARRNAQIICSELGLVVAEVSLGEGYAGYFHLQLWTLLLMSGYSGVLRGWAATGSLWAPLLCYAAVTARAILATSDVMDSQILGHYEASVALGGAVGSHSGAAISCLAAIAVAYACATLHRYGAHTPARLSPSLLTPVFALRPRTGIGRSCWSAKPGPPAVT